MNQLFSLSGRKILVTGGTRGIGKAIVKALVESQAEVIANYVRDSKSAESLLNELDASKVSLVRADLTRPKGMENLLQAVADNELHGILHCAATGVFGPAQEMNQRQFDWTMDLNVKAFLELVTRLKDNLVNGASVVALSSEGAVRAVPNYALVGASKAALESYCRHLAADMYPLGVRVNVLSPGSVITDSWKHFPDREQRIESVKSRIPGGEMTTLDEIASVAAFLCSDASRGINGQTLVVDRGERIVM
jgi:enoyl-[acyl-carrier protein] reductase III